MRYACAVSVIAATGCLPHVDLRPPAPNFTPEQRVAMYNALHGDSERSTITTTCNRGGCSSNEQRSIILANGTEVYHPEDLLPLLPANSVAVRHIEAADQAANRKYWSSFGAVASVAIGAPVMFSGFSMDPSVPNDTTRTEIGTAILLGGGLLFTGLWYYFHHVELSETTGAHYTYNAGLAETLNVCVSGMQVIPCEFAAPGSPPPGLGRPLPGPAPYPFGSSPYPPGSAPMPAAPPNQSPYPPAQTTYPPAPSPYPPAPSPYPPAAPPSGPPVVGQPPA